MKGTSQPAIRTAMVAAPGTMTEAEFRAFARLVTKRIGWKLCGTKRYLVESRLAERAAATGVGGVPEYVARLLSGAAGDEEFQEIVDRVTINETSFFRDELQIDFFAQRVLPGLLAARRGGRGLRVWSAACSTGEEAYSLAMQIERAMSPETGGVRAAGFEIGVVGTDISARAIEAARSGRYADSAARSVPEWARNRFFEREGREVLVAEPVRSVVTFEVRNLLDSGAPGGVKEFDVIFCRNALMYFDDASRVAALRLLAARLAPMGVLFLGRTERIEAVGLEACGGMGMGCYRRMAAEHRAAA